MNIHFSLRQQGNTDPKVILQVFDARFIGRKFMYSTGASVSQNLWDKRKERAKVAGSRGLEMSDLNRHLDTLNQAVIDFLSIRHNSSALDRATLRKYLDATKNNERKEVEIQLQRENDYFIVWQKIIDSCKNSDGEPIVPSTRVSKIQTLSLLRQFVLTENLSLTFESIDMGFYHRLDQYMIDKGLSSNSRGKHFKEIKAILREAEERDIKVSQAFRKKGFKVIQKETDNTY